MVFLVVENDTTYDACVHVLRALGTAQAVLHGVKKSANPWQNVNLEMGRATRTFQNAARNELQVAGPARPWANDSDDLEDSGGEDGTQ